MLHFKKYIDLTFIEHAKLVWKITAQKKRGFQSSSKMFSLYCFLQSTCFRESDLVNIIVVLGKVDLDIRLDEVRQVVPVFPVVRREDDGGNSGPFGGDYLLLDPTHRQHLSTNSVHLYSIKPVLYSLCPSGSAPLSWQGLS